MAAMPSQIGWIPYWNLLPLRHEILRMTSGAMTFMSGHPSEVNRWLREGVVSVAPASSIALLKNPNIELALPLGIASEGPVLSVYLGQIGDDPSPFEFIRSRQKELAHVVERCAGKTLDSRDLARQIWTEVSTYKPGFKDLPKLRLTSASAASAALTRVLLHLWYGSDFAAKILATASCVDGNSDVESKEAGFELVIGDESLQRRHEFSQILDLGAIWFELTGLPFVFGLWQTTGKPVVNGFRSLLMDAASLAQLRMRADPQSYFPDRTMYCGNGEPVDLASYWKVIQYKLDDRHFRSLLLYYALYLEVCARSDANLDAERMTRWSRTWIEASSGGGYL